MTKKGPILILGAMDGEIEAFLDNFVVLEKHTWKDFVYHSARFNDKEVIIAKTGVGKILAAMITQKMIDIFNPSAIFCTGIAGSLNPELEIGEILLGTDSVQHDFDAHNTQA